MPAPRGKIWRNFCTTSIWTCRNPGLALPLIALQYHEVKVVLNHQLDMAFDDGSTQKLWCDYIYLDTDERRRFAQVSHEYLIEQVQEQSLQASGSSDLNFNHPVKELIWVNKNALTASLGTTATGNTVAPVLDTGTYQLKLNGHDIFLTTITDISLEHKYGNTIYSRGFGCQNTGPGRLC